MTSHPSEKVKLCVGLGNRKFANGLVGVENGFCWAWNLIFINFYPLKDIFFEGFLA